MVLVGILLLTCTIQSCRSTRTIILPEKNKQQSASTILTGSASLPRCLVYKTRRDYKDKVPVLLNTAKTAIISYPASSDITSGENFSYPTSLEQAYLLDNRGITCNVAFLKYSYEEYSQLETVPRPDELFKHILDKDPLTELWDCGARTPENCNTDRLNKLIRDHFPGCKALLERIKRPDL